MAEGILLATAFLPSPPSPISVTYVGRLLCLPRSLPIAGVRRQRREEPRRQVRVRDARQGNDTLTRNKTFASPPFSSRNFPAPGRPTHAVLHPHLTVNITSDAGAWMLSMLINVTSSGVPLRGRQEQPALHLCVVRILSYPPADRVHPWWIIMSFFSGRPCPVVTA